MSQLSCPGGRCLSLEYRMEIAERLSMLRTTLEGSAEPQTETLRTILSWFGYQRRGAQVLATMQQAFAEYGVRTVPDLSEPWIDGEVTLSLAPAGARELPRHEALITRLGHLDAANRPPISVARDHAVGVAMTLMLRHDFSQLPVMRTEREVEGVISWRTIGEAIALGGNPQFVRECMESKVRTLKPDIPLTDAIDEIVRYEFVMVRAPDKRILGPVTTSDLASRYHSFAEPFLLISQIECAIRRVLETHVPLDTLKAAKFGTDARAVEKPEHLTFAEYKTALACDDVWCKLGIKLDKSEFLTILEDVRVARNEVMHFHPDGNADGAVDVLRNASRALQKIANATAC